MTVVIEYSAQNPGSNARRRQWLAVPEAHLRPLAVHTLGLEGPCFIEFMHDLAATYPRVRPQDEAQVLDYVLPYAESAPLQAQLAWDEKSLLGRLAAARAELKRLAKGTP